MTSETAKEECLAISLEMLSLLREYVKVAVDVRKYKEAVFTLETLMVAEKKHEVFKDSTESATEVDVISGKLVLERTRKLLMELKAERNSYS